MSETMCLFHALWTKAVGTKDYVKNQWMDLEKRMLEAEEKPSSPSACVQCRFWVEAKEHNVGPDLGECRLHAPVVGGPFPYMMKTDWCGEFQAKSVPTDLLAKTPESNN